MPPLTRPQKITFAEMRAAGLSRASDITLTITARI
jgi:hypothetical protein